MNKLRLKQTVKTTPLAVSNSSESLRGHANGHDREAGSLYSVIISSPIGKLGVQIEQHAIQRLDIVRDSMPLLAARDHLSELIARELIGYFESPHAEFSLTLNPAGTPFQQTVWKALSNIPLGETMTYQAIASRLKTSPRAIGQACKHNPIPIIIPCHRIIAKQHLGGFMGKTSGKSLDIKSWLLMHEKNKFRS